MKLKKIFFKSFKSLIDKEINFEYNCVGIVGTNESGKSNILQAINILGGERELTLKDTPKMAKNNYSLLEYLFELENNEIDIINELLNKWIKEKAIINNSIIIQQSKILYKIEFDKSLNKEKRSFVIFDIETKNKDLLILKKEFINDISSIKTKDGLFQILDTIIVDKKTLEYSNNYFEELNTKKTILNDKIKKIESSLPPKQVKTVLLSNGNKNKIIIPNKESIELEKLKEERNEINRQLSIDLDSIKQEIAENIETLKKSIQQQDIKIQQHLDKISELEKQNLNITSNKRAYSITKANLLKLNAKIKEDKNNLQIKEKQLIDLDTPNIEKYTSDLMELNNYISEYMLPKINNLLPKVVFWKHSEEYIIKSETQFEELLSKKNINEISRPLLNVFRIGLGIKDLKDLKEWINEIRIDSNERSKKEKAINTKVNRYIKSVWTDYDQKLKITLEKERIRIEIFDPSYDDASYYNMEDRSQGAQTFISFLLTIGAEAKQGVIRNNILLLDEPETHLHPSGVRFMLEELLKISENNNIVVYATHSIFMIDRDNFDRHFILNKKKERTNIKPGQIGRIGFFMQEEVLYKTLDIDLRKDFKSSNINNFVFEGYGDSILFEKFYSLIEKPPFKNKETSFYQGGKCSDIQKYFGQNPIQLGTKWIFIIDKDKPANNLKNFLEGKYKNYLDKDIFIFQFEKTSDTSDFSNKDFELEDLLPNTLITTTYLKTIESFSLKIDDKEIKKIIDKFKLYQDYNSKIIELIKEDIEIDDFKGKFKELLNDEIKTEISDCDSENKFKATFPEFYNWAQSIITNIK